MANEIERTEHEIAELISGVSHAIQLQ